MKKSIFVITTILAFMGTQVAVADDDTRRMHGKHMHGPLHGDKHEAMPNDMGHMKGAFMEEKEIDGYTVSFHVMKGTDHMEHGGSHNLMIKIEQEGKALTGLAVNSKVTHPDGNSETKMLNKMGDWYMAGYDLEHDGQHELMVLFKTRDGKKHFGGIYYPKQDDKAASEADGHSHSHDDGYSHQH